MWRRGLALVRYVGSGSPVGEAFVVDAAGEFHQLTGLGSTSSLGASLPACVAGRASCGIRPA
jgi:hypothetical protein